MVIKLMRMGWEGHAAGIAEKRHILIHNHLEDVAVIGKLI